MKELKDILLEKLSIDDINLNEDFPIDGTLEEIIDFLKGKGFKQVYPKGYIDEILNSLKSKCFTYDSILDGFIIWFADTSKKEVSKNNPIFSITYESNKNIIYNVYYPEKSNYGYSHKYIDIAENDKKEFLKELNKHFDW